MAPTPTTNPQPVAATGVKGIPTWAQVHEFLARTGFRLPTYEEMRSASATEAHARPGHDDYPVLTSTVPAGGSEEPPYGICSNGIEWIVCEDRSAIWAGCSRSDVLYSDPGTRAHGLGFRIAKDP